MSRLDDAEEQEGHMAMILEGEEMLLLRSNVFTACHVAGNDDGGIFGKSFSKWLMKEIERR